MCRIYVTDLSIAQDELCVYCVIVTKVDEIHESGSSIFVIRNMPTVTEDSLFLGTFDVPYSKCPNSTSSLAFKGDGCPLAAEIRSTFEEGEDS